MATQIQIFKVRRGNEGTQVEQHLKNEEKDGQPITKTSPNTGQATATSSIIMLRRDVVDYFTSVTTGEGKAARGGSSC